MNRSSTVIPVDSNGAYGSSKRQQCQIDVGEQLQVCDLLGLLWRDLDDHDLAALRCQPSAKLAVFDEGTNCHDSDFLQHGLGELDLAGKGAGESARASS